jgi:hypothetical protein
VMGEDAMDDRLSSGSASATSTILTRVLGAVSLALTTRGVTGSSV